MPHFQMSYGFASLSDELWAVLSESFVKIDVTNKAQLY